jgi:glucosamine-6-phosphate deaminase
MKLSGFSPVEERFFIESGNTLPTTRIPYIIASDFPKLRLLIALRFLEWVDESPEGDMFA